jgi:hypothetical protein
MMAGLRRARWGLKAEKRGVLMSGTRVRGLAVFAALVVTGLVAATPGSAWTDNPTEGCTPGYWKNHTESWVTYTPTQTVDSVFTGADPSLGTQTLLDALSFPGGSDLVGAEGNLLRAAVAGLLNDTSGIDYGVPSQAIIKAVNKRIATGDPKKMKKLANKLDARNNLPCPLS